MNRTNEVGKEAVEVLKTPPQYLIYSVFSPNFVMVSLIHWGENLSPGSGPLINLQTSSGGISAAVERREKMLPIGIGCYARWASDRFPFEWRRDETPMSDNEMLR